MDAHISPQYDRLRCQNHSTSEKECLPPIFSQALFDALPLDSFKEEFDRRINELPKGDYRRARALFIVGGHFNLHYCRSGSLALLDHATRCVEQAVKELPKSHEEFRIYVALYINLLRESVRKTHRLEDVDRYILSLQLCIKGLEECRFKQGKTRQLGQAYSLRASMTKTIKDISLAIETLEGCFKTLEKTYTYAALCLGICLYHRYEQDPQLDYLERSVEYIREALGAAPSNIPLDACERDGALKYIVSACAIANSTPCGNDMRSRLISNLEMVLSFTPINSKLTDGIEKQRLRLLMTQCFKEPDSIEELRDTILAHIVDEAAENRSPPSPTQLLPVLTVVFINKPLSDKKHIRLVTLLPGTREDFIHCKIFEKAMDNLPHYEVLNTGDAPKYLWRLITLFQALSYIWGDPTETRRICVNDGIYEATKNLCSALLRLRHPETERTLWVDALCINQADLKEKRHQIALMPDIYTKATTVIMWLGEPEMEEPPVKLNPEETKPYAQPSSQKLRGVELSVKPVRTIVTLTKTSPFSKHHKKHAIGPQVSVPNQSPKWHVFTKEDLPTLGEKLEWLKPFLFGCKPITAVSEEAIPGFLDMIQDIVKDIEWKELQTLIYHNIRFRRLPGPQLDIFDWSSLHNIPSFFKAPQTGTSWPVLGAFMIIHCFSQHEHFSELPFFGDATKLRFLDGPDTDLTYYSGQAWRKSVGALGRILASDYWHRAWILQEIVLARKPVVHYGPHIMPFTKFLRAAWSFGIHYGGCCSKFGHEAYRKEDTHWTKLMHVFAQLEYLELMRCEHGGSMWPSSRYSLKWSNCFSSLSSILRTGFTKRKATDPRDLVYGILGLADNDTNIEADYTISVAEVFTRAVMHIIQQDRSLAVLLFNEFGRDPKNCLPSWVPDWSARPKYFPTGYPEGLYKIHKTQPYLAELKDGLRLKVRVVKVDTINQVSEIRTHHLRHAGELVTQLIEWRRLAGLNSPNLDQNVGQNQVDDLERLFWRAVFADAIYEHDMEHHKADYHRKMRRFEPRDDVKVLDWWSWLQHQTASLVGWEQDWNSLRTAPHSDGFHFVTDRFWHATGTRKMIYTESNRIGTGPSADKGDVYFGDAKAGDEVHILFGISLPVILRRINKQQSSTQSRGKRYSFVGPCYLHGIMDDEILIDENIVVEETFLC